jgi:hypothetical protein
MFSLTNFEVLLIPCFTISYYFINTSTQGHTNPKLSYHTILFLFAIVSLLINFYLLPTKDYCSDYLFINSKACLNFSYNMFSIDNAIIKTSFNYLVNADLLYSNTTSSIFSKSTSKNLLNFFSFND